MTPECVKMAAMAKANHFRFTEFVSSPEIKNISLFTDGQITCYIFSHPVPLRGAFGHRHERGAGRGGR